MKKDKKKKSRKGILLAVAGILLIGILAISAIKEKQNPYIITSIKSSFFILNSVILLITYKKADIKATANIMPYQ